LQDDRSSAEEKAKSAAQAQALRKQAQEGGLRFETYLPPQLADWLLGLIERGVFSSPDEAAFVILGEHRELEPHADLRHELLKRIIQLSIDDPRPGIPAEEFFEKMRQKFAAPLPEPAVRKRQ
jgi:antitoxin ParD1/3/4